MRENKIYRYRDSWKKKKRTLGCNFTFNGEGKRKTQSHGTENVQEDNILIVVHENRVKF